jgi:NAD(P)-dependent dehydrogenase (short-subunit alcohol dehydrogenase family)
MANDDGFLSGRVALVTGGSRGIGRSVAQLLAAAGANVCLTGRNDEALNDAVLGIEAGGGRAFSFPCDIADETQVLDLFARIDAEGPLEILVNNAGQGIFKSVAETTVEEWDGVMGVNLRGAFLCGREAMRRMAGRGGRIVNIGSVVSLKGYAEQGAYTASKHGLLGLAKVMAKEGHGDGIVVQTVCPGGVDTPMAAESRPDLDRSVLMDRREVAEAVLFLLSQQGNAVTDLLQLRRRASAPS